MDFDQEHEDHEEDMAEIPEPAEAFESMTSERLRMGNDGGEGTSSTRKAISGVRYRECLKNHAVNIGAHAVDGCGEFIGAGEEGTLEGLKCAACSCHRNFHRKETDADRSFQQYHHYQQQYHHPQFSPFYRGPLQPSGYLHLASPSMQQRPLALPSPSGGGAFSRNDEDASNPSSSGGDGSGLKKRFRSKFTQEQKEKMLAFAEGLGWRIQKHDEGAVDQFCAENCVKRQVFKVWMHNNKHTLAISAISVRESFENGGPLRICSAKGSIMGGWDKKCNDSSSTSSSVELLKG